MRSRSSEPALPVGARNRRGCGRDRARRAPSAGFNRVRFQGFLSIPARPTPALSSLLGIPLAAVWDYTCRSHDNAAYAQCAADQLSPGWRRDGGRVTPRHRPRPRHRNPRLRPRPRPATQTPAPHRRRNHPRARRRADAPSARSGMAITVTSPQGATISGVHVALMGPTERGGDTDGSGQVNFPGLQAGTYRLRFSGDKVTAFEKEVVVRAGTGLRRGRLAQRRTGAEGGHGSPHQRCRRARPACVGTQG